MYLDYILFTIGAALLLIFLILIISLLRSRKASRDFLRILHEETVRVDIINTLRKTASAKKAHDTPSELQTTQKIVREKKRLSPTEKIDLEANPFGNEIDFSALSEKYELLKIIHKGDLSCVFLARHKKLDNEWIVKFVSQNHAELAEEAEILKKLNHISLPQIIDIFQSTQGMFLVERYIEGYSLDNVHILRKQITEGQICEWGIQLAQVLHYLHNLDIPIYHCDLKPDNIMVTYDNRLVLVDFGISKQQGNQDNIGYLTYSYAAPEQFQLLPRDSHVIQKRFGSLPAESVRWQIDGRTDLYSVGVILYELITGRLPTSDSIQDIYSYATPKLAAIVCKCLNTEPDQRFQTAKELLDALEEVQTDRGNIIHRLRIRRIAAVFCVLSLLGGSASTVSAAYINRMENLSILSIDPSYAIVTVQDSIQPFISRTTPTGKVTNLIPSQIKWSYSTDSIAQINGDRLYGINIGKTTFYGTYRKNTVSLDVEVREAVNNSSISLRYPKGVDVSVYAGNGERDFTDGNISNCSFVSPESLFMGNGILYISDSGLIRRVQDGAVSTIELEPDYLTANLLRRWNENLYVLTGAWENDSGDSYYGFLEIGSEEATLIYMTDAAMSTVSDFAFSEDGTLWFIQQNIGIGMTTLNTLNVSTMKSEWIMDLPDGAHSMSFDKNGNLYISVPYSGIILRIEPGSKTPSYFVGIENERNFIDGVVPNFYQPSSLAVDGDSLYVLDFDTVRRISIRQTGVPFTETLAGVPINDLNPNVVVGEGWQTILPASESASITVGERGEILLSDPKNSVIYQITQRNL